MGKVAEFREQLLLRYHGTVLPLIGRRAPIGAPTTRARDCDLGSPLVLIVRMKVAGLSDPDFIRLDVVNEHARLASSSGSFAPPPQPRVHGPRLVGRHRLLWSD